MLSYAKINCVLECLKNIKFHKTRVRCRNYKFPQPTHKSWFVSGIMMKNPSSSQSFFAFLMPFTAKLWCFILVSFVATGLTLVLVTYLSRTAHTCSCVLCPWRKTRRSESKLQVFDNLWFLLAALLQQGTSFEPK